MSALLNISEYVYDPIVWILVILVISGIKLYMKSEEPTEKRHYHHRKSTLSHHH